MNTHESYISLETARLLKQAGFDWEVNHSYPDCESLDNSCSGYMEDLSFYHNLNDGKYGGMSAPTLAVTQRWLREVKGVEVDAYVFYDYEEIDNGWDCYTYNVNHITKRIEDWIIDYNVYKSYEEALETGIKKVLKLILEKDDN